MRRVHLFIDGRVQGVFFRASTREKARQLGVDGFVRNLRDGRVEIVAEGDEQALNRLIEWARNGPPDAYVTEADISWEEPRGEFSGFTVRH
ncbi:MAG: acylphosphatase [Chloroflexota bacterium]|nr:acylphosphatase [Chloroflexota bacterium]